MKNIRSSAWATQIDGTRVEMNYVDCYMLLMFRVHASDVGGLAGLSAQVILDDMKEFFGDSPTLFEVIEATKNKFESFGLIVAKEHNRSGVWVYPTATLMSVANRLVKSIQQSTPLVWISNHTSKSIDLGAQWCDEPFCEDATDSEQATNG